MKDARLSARWRKAQRELEAALIADGWPREVAAEVAHKDAYNRARLATVVGARIAADASLFLDARDGRGVGSLSLDLSLMPERKRDAARAALLSLGARRVN